MSVVGLSADNSTMSGTSVLLPHLSHPTLVSPPLVRQRLSVVKEINGKLRGGMGVFSVSLAPQTKNFCY